MDLTKAEELSLWKSHHTRGGRAYPHPVRQISVPGEETGRQVHRLPQRLLLQWEMR